MAREFNISPLFIGDDAEIEMDMYDEEGSVLEVPLDWTFEWVLRRGRSAADASLEKDDSAIDVLTGEEAPNGDRTRVRVTVEAADTTDLEPDSYFHTLRRADSGAKTTLSYGNVNLVWSAAR